MTLTDQEQKTERDEAAAIETKEKVMTKDRMTKEEFLASRKAAGRVIDVETCKIMTRYTNLCDPYCLNPPPRRSYNDVLWVASDETGAVYVDDLPEDKARALLARLARDYVQPRDDLPFG